MIGFVRIRRAAIVFLFAAASALYVSAQDSQNFPSQPLRYTLSLAKAPDHVVTVKIELPPGAAERTLQLPVWYALYQVRDFAQYVRWVRIGTDSLFTVRKVGKSQWRISGIAAGGEIEYEIFANDPGPFGAQFNAAHAFFNLAEILMYPTDARNSPMEIRFTDVPKDWRFGTTLRASASGFTAGNYDELADSPVELGAFEESDFDEDGGHYRVIVDAVRGSYDMRTILPMLRRIISAETSWMADRPFSTYLFIYHFPHESGGGGMEHANSTAIDVDARTLATDPHALEGVTAHELFHAWNVKRIRPQSLEPPDYTKENYTDALWFSEGVTSTVEDYMLLRAGLLDEHEYLTGLARAITELKNRHAHSTQSAEDSSLDAWLEEYSYYRKPERSISYYNKGYLLGVMLDLKLRDGSNGTKSLRDLFQWMNSNYAQKHKFFPDSLGIEQAAEAISQTDLALFFQKYVGGADEIPWNDFLRTIGLRLVTHEVQTADAGFIAARNVDSSLTVISVADNSQAESAGLASGDVILEIDHHPPSGDFEHILSALHPGDKIQVRVRNRDGKHERSWKLDARKALAFRIQDGDNVTPQQKRRRAAWLKGESEEIGLTHK